LANRTDFEAVAKRRTPKLTGKSNADLPNATLTTKREPEGSLFDVAHEQSLGLN
jgi:hypothetical protein